MEHTYEDQIKDLEENGKKDILQMSDFIEKDL